MKNSFLIILLVAFAHSMVAQESTNKTSKNQSQWNSTVAIGTGILTRQGLRDFGDTFIKEEFKNLYPDNNVWVGSVNSTQDIPFLEIRYKYLINPIISLGIRASYVNYKHNGNLTFDDGDLFKASWNIRYITGMLDVDFIYVNKEFVKLYAGFSAGVSQYNLKFASVSNHQYDDMLDKTEDRMYFAYEVIAFGITFGKQIGGFAELGYGYAGMINMGVYVRF